LTPPRRAPSVPGARAGRKAPGAAHGGAVREDLQKLMKTPQKAGVALTAVQNAHIRRWVAQMHSRRAQRARHRADPLGLARLSTPGWAARAWCPNPVQDVRAPKARKPLPKALGVDEAVQLADHVTRRPTPGWRRATPPWSSCSTAAACAWANWSAWTWRASTRLVDLQAGEAHVLGKGSKRRMVPVGSKALAALQRWLARAKSGAQGARGRMQPALFVGLRGTRMTAQSVWQRLKRAASKAGWPPRCTRTCCAIRLPAMCCSPAATCGQCRNCWATPTSPHAGLHAAGLPAPGPCL
jgi:integrase/recombinase XerC